MFPAAPEFDRERIRESLGLTCMRCAQPKTGDEPEHAHKKLMAAHRKARISPSFMSRQAAMVDESQSLDVILTIDSVFLPTDWARTSTLFRRGNRWLRQAWRSEPPL